MVVEVEVRLIFFKPSTRIPRLIELMTQHPRAGTIKLVAPAVTYDGKRMPVRRPPPWLSQHTTEVCSDRSHGYNTR
jgi:succinate--hydroxymethylglutarate CoA-transferase